MPWTSEDFPIAMKNLSPKRREKAISIANKILEKTNDEGKAIATGIKMSKSLIKLAAEKIIVMPISHLATDGKELDQMKKLCTGILNKINEMKADDAKSREMAKNASDNEPDNRVTMVGGIAGGSMGLMSYMQKHHVTRHKTMDEIHRRLRKNLNLAESDLIDIYSAPSTKEEQQALGRKLMASNKMRNEITDETAKISKDYAAKYGTKAARFKTFGKGLAALAGGALLAGAATRLTQNKMSKKEGK